MSAAPDATITVVDEPELTVDPTDTGVHHLVATAYRALSTGPRAVSSNTELARVFGPEQTYSALHKYARAFFAFGGASLVVSRAVGDAATTATRAVPGSVGTSLYVDAISPGDWGNDLSVQIIDSSGSKILAVFDGTEEVERTAAFSTQAQFRDWSQTSEYVRVRVGAGTTLPAVLAKTALTGGEDDVAAVDDDNLIAALDALTEEFGVGQVSVLGSTSTTVQQAVADHADAFNRHGLLDATAGLSVSALVAAANAVTGDGARSVELWAQQATIAGSVQGSQIRVPWSAVQAGLIAKTDRQYGPSQPAAGRFALAPDVLFLSTEYTSKDDRDTLSEAGVNIARTVDGVVQPYDNKTLASPSTEAQWVQASRSREVMRLKAQLLPVLKAHQFARIDGQGVETGNVIRDLEGVLLGEWQNGALFGAVAADAFGVSVTVDTDTDASSATVNADVWVRTSPYGATINLNLTHRLEV